MTNHSHLIKEVKTGAARSHSEQLCQFDTFLQPSVKLSETIVFIPPRLKDPRWCVIHTRVGQDGTRSVDKHTPGGCFQAV